MVYFYITKFIMQNENETNNSGIGFSDIIRVIKKNWILICAIIVIIFGIGTVYTLAIKKPTYKSTSSVVVVIPTDKTKEVGAEGNSVDVTYSRNIAYTVVDTVTKTSILGDIAENHDLSYSHLRGMVSA